MKTIVEINNNNYGSTGNIMLNIAKEARNNGYKVYTFCKNSKQAKKITIENHFYIGTWLGRVISERIAYITGLKDHFNIINTKLFINQLNRLKPDLIHMHNMHDTFINLNMLFKYIKKNNIPVIWTLHDSFPFTGQCTCYELAKCNKWKSGCGNCPQINKYPDTLVDRTKYLWKKKKEWFSNINDFTFIAPSYWMKNQFNQSFLHSYPIEVINNGINLNIFKPTISDFKKTHNILNKHILLGVATNWEGKRKGLDIFVELSNKLPSDYQIVLVGTNDAIDKLLPNNIISIHKTYNIEELVKIYSAADIFINPTREDNFPTVNIEALACGTPVITFNTGGSPEILNDACGRVVETNDINSLIDNIIDITNNKIVNEKDCLKQSANYNMTNKYKEYIKLYNKKLEI